MILTAAGEMNEERVGVAIDDLSNKADVSGCHKSFKDSCLRAMNLGTPLCRCVDKCDGLEQLSALMNFLKERE